MLTKTARRAARRRAVALCQIFSLLRASGCCLLLHHAWPGRVPPPSRPPPAEEEGLTVVCACRRCPLLLLLCAAAAAATNTGCYCNRPPRPRQRSSTSWSARRCSALIFAGVGVHAAISPTRSPARQPRSVPGRQPLQLRSLLAPPLLRACSTRQITLDAQPASALPLFRDDPLSPAIASTSFPFPFPQ